MGRGAEESGRRSGVVVAGVAAAAVVFIAVPAVLVLTARWPFPTRWGRAELVSWHGLFDGLTIVAWVAWLVCAWPVLVSVARRVRTRDVDPSPGDRFLDRVAVRIAAGVLALAATAGMGATAASAVGAPRPGATVVATPDRGAGSPVMAVAGSASLQTRPGSGGGPPVVIDGGATPRALPGPEAASPTAASNAPSPAASATPTPARSKASPAAGGPDRAPEFAVLGLGALVAALVARRIRRERRLASFLRGEGQPYEPPDAELAALATSVDGLADLPLVDLIESAWYRLGAADPYDPDDPSRPVGAGAHVVRAGPAGMEIHLATERAECPEGWHREGPSRWRLDRLDPADAIDPLLRGGAAPWRPLLLPLGENDDGAWLVALDAGTRISVLGPNARELIAAVCAAARSWSWHEDVVVTATATLAAARAGVQFTRRSEHDVHRPSRTGILFTGDPRVLAPGVEARCATVTAEALPAELTVMVDDRGATVHPLGLVLRPHRLGPGASRAVEQLLDGPSGDGARPSTNGHPLHLVHAGRRITARLDHGDDGVTSASVTSAPPPGRSRPRAPSPVPAAAAVPAVPAVPAAAAAAVPAAAATTRRPVVRLLAAVPRIDGLMAPLDPKRTRRAVELVAYLGIWHPDPVTGDRLRARVLGTADADAAAKTLFNTAGAARRALGCGENGDPLLPLASRSGHYRLSPDVALDAVRAGTLLAEGISTSDGPAAAALVTEGLSLIEGEPLAGTLTGYGWWRGEGHERRLSDVVVDGACRLVRLCVETSELDRARWAIERARLVEPYSEALSRAAMVVAAATGDAGRLQREWFECRRLMDDLDPGSLPSDATERLYERLRRQLTAGAAAGARA